MIRLMLAIVGTAMGSLAATVNASPPTHVANESPGWKIEGVPDSKSIGAKPITLKIAVEAKLVPALTDLTKSAQGKGSLRFSMQGLDLPQNVGIKVFVNSPETEPLPKAASDHYLGMIGGFGPNEKKEYFMDLAPTLRKLAAKKLWSAGEPIVIRMVAAPINPKLPISETAAKFDAVSIELPK